MNLTSTEKDSSNRLLRASDEDRDQVVEQLRSHCAAGRLTADELADRAQAAYAARTLGELDIVLDDLPRPPSLLKPLTGTHHPRTGCCWWCL
ncbi:MAG: DUF1707 SHOCT-like domain-containing protein [Solirubrobacteraceae bacterium]